MRFLFVLVVLIAVSFPAQAQEKPSLIKSITVEGGPIATKHFQSEDENFRERHGLTVVKVETNGYGNWGAYFLSPNSVEDPSFGVGYVTNPYRINLGLTDLELSAALGLVTGYQDFPVPLVAGQARLKLYERGAWNAGVAMAVLPYIAENEITGNNDFGVVGTTPFLSVRYKFN